MGRDHVILEAPVALVQAQIWGRQEVAHEAPPDEASRISWPGKSGLVGSGQVILKFLALPESLSASEAAVLFERSNFFGRKMLFDDFITGSFVRNFRFRFESRFMLGTLLLLLMMLMMKKQLLVQKLMLVLLLLFLLMLIIFLKRSSSLVFEFFSRSHLDQILRIFQSGK